MLAFCSLEHLVLAGIAVTGEVADIGDIHGSLYVIAVIYEKFFQYILHDVCAKISYMREMVNGRSAGIHADGIPLMRGEFFYLLGKGIVKLHRSFSFLQR